MSNALGIDIYEGSGDITWSDVLASGRVFASIKVAEGVTYRDSRYKTNYAGAGAVGILRMAYIYAHPNDDPKATVDNLLGAIEGMTFELGIALDLEVTGGLTPAQLQTWVDTFSSCYAAKTGEPPLDYSYPTFIQRNKLRFGGSGSRGLWIASYGARPSEGWTFWQYSSTGSVPGVPGPCDLDEFNGTVDQLKAWAKGEYTVPTTYPSVNVTVDGKPYLAIFVNGDTYVIWTAWRDVGANLTKVAAGDVEIDGKKPPQIYDGKNTYIIYTALPNESYTRNKDGPIAFSTQAQPTTPTTPVTPSTPSPTIPQTPATTGPSSDDIQQAVSLLTQATKLLQG